MAGKCKRRTKAFFKGLLSIITPQLMYSGGVLVKALATNVASGALSGHDKRAVLIKHLQTVAKEEGHRLEEWAARAVTEYLYKNIVQDHLEPEDLTDADDVITPDEPELADA